jgi:hypothetical protein
MDHVTHEKVINRVTADSVFPQSRSDLIYGRRLNHGTESACQGEAFGA